jgi:HEAT repeat protein
MSSIILALSFLAAAQAIPDGWTEVRFHRVHLRNGNFIDGNVIADKPGEVVLMMKWGEMSIRRDQVDKVELVKMKSYNEKPIILATPKGTQAPPTNPATNTPTPAVQTPEAIKKSIDRMILKMKAAGGEKEFPLNDLKPMGEEGAMYLASKAADVDLSIQNAIMAALINLGKPGPKLAGLLEDLLTNEKASLRGLALTVLTSEGGDAERSKYIRPALRDPDAGVRIIAISSLGPVEDRDWFTDAVELFGDTNKDVRSRAISVCKRLAASNGLNDRLLAAAISNLKSADEGVRAEMATVIGVIGIRDTWAQLAPMLLDSDASVRAAAAQALVTIAAPESGPDIVTAMGRETDRWCRTYLAGAAQKLRLTGAVSALIGWLGDPEKDVQNVAESALRTLTGESFGKDQGRWAAWLQNRPK